MRIYTKSGDLAFKTFSFPDGQPHFKLETYDREFSVVTVEMAIRNPGDLFLLLLATDVLRQHGYSEVNFDCRYLLGARMDRAISPMEPFTLQTIARLINSAGFSRVRFLDVHSEVATRLIRNSVNLLPFGVVASVHSTLGWPDVVIPDKGAASRVHALMGTSTQTWVHQCYKERDPKTGALSNFKVPSEGLQGRDLLIVDDICDGGGTFVGLAKELRSRGAKSVNLFVTHGIFSKGLPLEGIDTIYTTDSYQPDTYGFKKVVCIPISMKEM
jgi:ribose-phosphate pyrophosphokinase